MIKSRKNKLHLSSVLVLMAVTTSCTFNFELTTQRTALENQIVGDYDEPTSEAILVEDKLNAAASDQDAAGSSAVLSKTVSSNPVDNAKKNQEFNADDIEELKDDQILGEAKNGELALLPKEIGLRSQATEEQTELAKILLYEENRDRKLMLRDLEKQFQDNETGSKEGTQTEFREQFRSRSKNGHWLQNDSGIWQQKR